MVLLVPYHANRFIRVEDDPPSWADPFGFLIHTFHMPLFFALSGYLAAGAVARRGAAAGVRERLMRLGIPLLVAVVTVIPLVNLVVNYYATRNPGPTPEGFSLSAEDIFHFKPLILWFLLYLLILSLAAIAIWALLRGTRPGAWVHRAFRIVVGGPLAIPLLAIAAAAVLMGSPDWEATRTVGGTFVPDAALIVYYAIFFAFGWLLSGNKDLLPKVERLPLLHLVLGVAAAAVAYGYYDDRFRDNDPFLHDVTLLLGAGFACWLILFGLWGTFARWLRNPNPVVAYVADASFWIYLIHLPALLLVENALARTDLPAGTRLGVAVAGALAFSLLTYAIFVRRTPIGRFLRGGKRLPPRGAAGRQGAPAPASS